MLMIYSICWCGLNTLGRTMGSTLDTMEYHEIMVISSGYEYSMSRHFLLQRTSDYECPVFMTETAANEHVSRTITTTLNLVMRRIADDVSNLSLVGCLIYIDQWEIEWGVVWCYFRCWKIQESGWLSKSIHRSFCIRRDMGKVIKFTQSFFWLAVQCIHQPEQNKQDLFVELYHRIHPED